DVLALAVAKTEDRPARAEGAIGDGDESIAPEQSAGIVLTDDVAIDDVDVLIAVDMKTVVVEVDAVMDANAVQLYVTAFEQANAVVSGTGQKNIAHDHIAATIEDGQVRTVAVSFGGVAAGTGVVALARIEKLTLSVDRARAFDRQVFGIHGVQHH